MTAVRRNVVALCAAAAALVTGAMALAPAAHAAGDADVRTVTRSELGRSWHPGCPVAVRDLRAVTVTYYGFDGVTRRGEIIVRRDVVPDVAAAFAAAYGERMPIAAVGTAASWYRSGDNGLTVDKRLMRANVTSGFNCRRVAGTSHWSSHAYGTAIDVNPVQNPYRAPSGWLPSPRNQERSGAAGQLTARSALVQALTRRGWTWGGTWRAADYQHLQAGS